jgi:hypothetical protein
MGADLINAGILGGTDAVFASLFVPPLLNLQEIAMAKPSRNASKSAPKSAGNGRKAAAPKVAARSEMRNSPIPKVAATTAKAPAALRELTYDQIAHRAYEIWSSGQGGSDFDNWVRAERELRTGL